MLRRGEIDFATQAAINEYRNKPWFAKRNAAYEFLGEEDRFDTPADAPSHTTEGHFLIQRFYGDNVLFVILRGSEEEEKDNQDWKSNMEFGLLPARDALTGEMEATTAKVPTCAKVHKGFKDGWKEIKQRVITKSHGYGKIVFCGHSRGAAVATIGAENIAFLFPSKQVYLVALSCPPCGNEYFHASAGLKLAGRYHFWYGDDTVVRGPQTYTVQYWMGYRATPVETHMGKNRLLPWNWLTKLFSWPGDHWPDLLQNEMRLRLTAAKIKADDLVPFGVKL